MNLHKSVHILLAVLLCFGQLVASAHVVSHVQFHDVPSSVGSEHDHNHQHSSHLGHHHDVIPVGSVTKSAIGYKAGSQPSAEKDCAIYHVFLSLGGAVLNSASPLAASVPCFLPTPYVSHYGPQYLVGHTRIRAPPVNS